MKNMILGMMGSLILINTLCICLCLLTYSPGVRAMRIQEKQIVEYTQGHWRRKEPVTMMK